ncbi:NLR family CARD domain-containing protein 3 [Labeo rohita]|uniref:NLR family CARD domain-containing protein 3 n=1 Tax=Labeo rohita TaxID=84645 RepID=A0ABQ8L3C0_LABRO|nr:NLR family CARD domain-containing protein 3 [Labeo rohita]
MYLSRPNKGSQMDPLASRPFLPITSRPAAANQIPSKYINRLTEIRGFDEPQKEEYFRKRISDQHQASRILHIMCHIPVFCWISSTVLQKLLKEDLSAEIPQTLTEMYIHFLLIQINMRNQKYEERDPEKLLQSNREVIVKLAEVAFKQLMKGMFYEEDLIESSIYVTDASVYSGICTEIFKEESVIHQRKIYSFIHLSIQEFLAAFYVEIGQLDLFLRFLLGVSLESNQRLLQDLLTQTEYRSESIRRTTQYIKYKIKDPNGFHNLSAGQSINLFLCLLEMKDQSLSREIQEFVKSDKHSEEKLFPAHCSTITYMLQMSEEPLDELNLKKYNTSDEGRRRLIPAVINCRKALSSFYYDSVFKSEVVLGSCESLSSALPAQSLNCALRELDLSNNDLLSDGLKSLNCQLQILSVACCNVTTLCSLSSNPSHLRELDLSYNHPGQSGVQLLKHKLEDPNYKLQILTGDIASLSLIFYQVNNMFYQQRRTTILRETAEELTGAWFDLWLTNQQKGAFRSAHLCQFCCCAVLHNLTLLNGDVVEPDDEKDHEDAPLNLTTLRQEQENMCGTIWLSLCLLDYL